MLFLLDFPSCKDVHVNLFSESTNPFMEITLQSVRNREDIHLYLVLTDRIAYRIRSHIGLYRMSFSNFHNHKSYLSIRYLISF